MYAKIFAQIFDSSLAEDYVTRHIFMDLIVLADPEGQLDMTYEAIARRTNVPLEIVQESIHKLCKPDVNSRVKRERGKRLVPLDAERSWGWQIVNYKMYRSLKNQITRREYMRLYMQKRRAEEVARVNTSKTSKQNVSIRSKQKKEEVSKVQKTLAPNDKKHRSEPPTVPDDLKGLKLYEADPKLCREWSEFKEAALTAYPGVDFMSEVRQAHAWEVANPSRRKINRTAYLHKWLAKQQDNPRPSQEKRRIF